MANYTPDDMTLVSRGLQAAIAAGHADGIDLLLRQVPLPPAPLLGKAIHAVLDAEPYDVASNFRFHGGNLTSRQLPRSATLYEGNLKRIVTRLAGYGADFSVTDEMGDCPAQRCFNNAADNRGHPGNSTTRWPACVEIVRQTLLQNPDWQPDTARLFTALPYVPEDKEAAGHRRDIARFANTLGANTANWLQGNSESAVALRLRIPSAALTYWRSGGWQCDPDTMPWMDAKLLHHQRETGQVEGTAFARMLHNSGLTFAFGQQGAQSAIDKAKGASHKTPGSGKKPTPEA